MLLCSYEKIQWIFLPLLAFSILLWLYRFLAVSKKTPKLPVAVSKLNYTTLIHLVSLSTEESTQPLCGHLFHRYPYFVFNSFCVTDSGSYRVDHFQKRELSECYLQARLKRTVCVFLNPIWIQRTWEIGGETLLAFQPTSSPSETVSTLTHTCKFYFPNPEDFLWDTDLWKHYRLFHNKFHL